jgi:hypothetical protein
MKIAPLLNIVLCVSFLFTLFAPLVEAAPKQNAREYRPLAAKAVRITVAGAAAQTGKGAAMTREGWAHFDKKEWELAMDRFLSALEADSTDESAAEGLTMAVYQSGDRASAAELAEEFAEVMPWIRRMVAETVFADVQSEVERGELSSAETLMGDLPYGAGAYDRVRSLVEGALAESAEDAKTAVAEVGN